MDAAVPWRSRLPSKRCVSRYVLFESYQTDGFYDGSLHIFSLLSRHFPYAPCVRFSSTPFLPGRPTPPRTTKAVQRLCAMSAETSAAAADLPTDRSNRESRRGLWDGRGTEKPWGSIHTAYRAGRRMGLYRTGTNTAPYRPESLSNAVYPRSKDPPGMIGVVPREMVVWRRPISREFMGPSSPGGLLLSTSAESDLSDDADGTYRVLEDNSEPSGSRPCLRKKKPKPPHTRPARPFRDLAVRTG